MQWLRLYSEARVDRKLQTLSDAQFRVWFNLLCFANEQRERGRFMLDDLDVLAIEVAGGDVELLQSTLDRLEKLKILSVDAESCEFRNFEKRQYDKPSDRPERVAERVRKHRATKRNADVTPCNALYTDTDTEEKGANAPARANGVAYPPGFLQFWAAYPRKVSKDDAFKAWRQLRPSHADLGEMLQALVVQKQSAEWCEEGGRFIPHPGRWLRAGRWKDEGIEELHGPKDQRRGVPA